MTTTAAPDRKGLAFALAAYASWGVLPLYLHMLKGVPASQVVANRVVWSLLLLVAVVLIAGRVRQILSVVRGRTLLLLTASTLLIGTNWLLYIWAVLNEHILAASLGYFINPLVNVALGVIVLGERMRRWQGVAIAIAALGVAVLALSGGAGLWISLGLAFTFGLYGLVRKIVAIDALGGLTVETALLAPFCLGWLVYSAISGTAALGTSLSLTTLLILAGPVTALPLLWFAAGARRLPLSMMGLLQYLSPSLQFGIAILFGEELHTAHIVTFALIWAGCCLYAWDNVRSLRAPIPHES